MYVPPDLGKQYVRELERKQREEAYLREGRTGQPSSLLRRHRLGIGQKLMVLGGVAVLLMIFMVVVAALTTPVPD